MSASWETQVSIFNALAANSAFMSSISNNLFDEPPTNETYPYVTLGYVVENADNTHGGLGYELIMTLEIYTKPGKLGYKTAKGILAKMNDVLNMKIFSMPTMTMLKCFYESSTTFKDNDVRGITAYYKILTEVN